MKQDNYTREQVQAILAKALQRQAQGGDVRRQDLIDAARDVGLTPEELSAAEVELAVEEQVGGGIVQLKRKARRGWWAHVANYALVCSLLSALDWVTPEGPWAQFVWLGWGFGVGAHLLALVFRDDDSWRQRAEKLLVRQRAAEERRRGEDERRRRREQLERDIERSVSGAVGAVANVLDEVSRRGPKGN